MSWSDERFAPRPSTVYAIEFVSAAEREFESLDAVMKKRVARRIDSLAANPRPADCKKLSGSESTYRIRVGDFRILYEVEDKRIVIVVVRIGNRRDIYRR